MQTCVWLFGNEGVKYRRPCQ